LEQQAPPLPIVLGVALARGAICFIQLGNALTVPIIGAIGVLPAVVLRNSVAAAALLAIARPAIGSVGWRERRVILGFGLILAVHGLATFSALDRIPLGVALAIGFLGPLGVATAAGRRLVDFICVAVAAVGIVLLVEPFGGGGLDPVGLAAAALSASCWAAYIVLSARLARTLGGIDGIALSMGVSAILLVAGVPLAVDLSAIGPGHVAVGAAAAVLSTAIPFAMETIALRRLPLNAFGLLASTEPAVAAVLGAGLLGQSLSVEAALGIALVVVASAIVAWSAPRP